MHSTRVGAVIGLAIGTIGLSAAAAVGSPSGDQTIDISSRHAVPGSTVTVSTKACGAETYGKGTSEAAGAFHLLAGDHKGVLVGEFRIPADAEPGTDTVTVKCPPQVKITDTYRIGERTPRGAIAAGLGTPDEQGFQLAVGGALLAGAVTGGVIRLRRRMSADRT
ncbi:MAG TPA: sortase [Streptomyces sp.]|jgi:hypothetical protein